MTATLASAAASVPTKLEKGLDLSVHSGIVDWEKLVEQGFDFVFLKASEGVDLADSAFAGHWESAGQQGLVRGAYHFYVTEDDPKEQAEFFIKQAQLGSGDFAPVVDIELIGNATKPGLSDPLHTFLDLLEEHYGVRPIIYTSPNFWDAHLDATFGDYPLWIAEYGVEVPRIPVGWERWSVWQFADDSDVHGVEKDADLNRLHPGVGVEALVIP